MGVSRERPTDLFAAETWRGRYRRVRAQCAREECLRDPMTRRADVLENSQEGLHVLAVRQPPVPNPLGANGRPVVDRVEPRRPLLRLGANIDSRAVELDADLA